MAVVEEDGSVPKIMAKKVTENFEGRTKIREFLFLFNFHIDWYIIRQGLWYDFV